MASDAQTRAAQRALDRAVANRKKAETALAAARTAELAAQVKLDALVHSPTAPPTSPTAPPTSPTAPAVPKATPAWESNFAKEGAKAFAPWKQTQVWDAQSDTDPRGWIRRCQNEWHTTQNRMLQPAEIADLAQHLQIYVGGMGALDIPDPISFSSDGLRITARRNADALNGKLWSWSGRWTSGFAHLSGVFEQRLGRWTTRCRWNGGWGSFWGVPSVANGGQELDFLEAVNAKRGLTTASAHGSKAGASSHAGPVLGSITPGDWVEIEGVWTDTELVTKVNGAEAGRISLVGLDMSKTIYPILALEIGAGRGWTDQTEPVEDEVWIEYDYVRIWAP